MDYIDGKAEKPGWWLRKGLEYTGCPSPALGNSYPGTWIKQHEGVIRCWMEKWQIPLPPAEVANEIKADTKYQEESPADDFEEESLRLRASILLTSRYIGLSLAALAGFKWVLPGVDM